MPTQLVKSNSVRAPYNENIVDGGYKLSRIWQSFFAKIQLILAYVGPEYSFPLVNAQATAAPITDLLFDFQYTSRVEIDYLIQRTTSTNEVVRSGKLNAIWRPKSLSWSIAEVTGMGDASGITFTISAKGQINYTSTDVTGTKVISRMVFRITELAGKTAVYSNVG